METRERLCHQSCAECGQLFKPDRRTGRFCSLRCQEVYHHPPRTLAASLDNINCAECGQSFKPARRNVRFCSKACQRADTNRRWAPVKAKEKAAIRFAPRICEECGDTFISTTRTGPIPRYCSELCVAEVRREWYRGLDDEGKKAHQHRNRATLYGLTAEALAALLAVGRCGACGTTNSGRIDWCVDHDHSCCPGRKSCGRCVRGLLCGPCNSALGQVKDDPLRLRMLADYLERSVG